MNTYENRSFARRNVVWIVAMVALVIFGFLLWQGWANVVNTGIDGRETVIGYFTCLPLKDTTKTDDTCMLGLRTKEGEFYALDIAHIQDFNTDLKAEDTIAVTGQLQRQWTSVKWDDYNVQGVLQVNTLLRTR